MVTTANVRPPSSAMQQPDSRRTRFSRPRSYKRGHAITEAAHHDLIDKAGQRESQRDFTVLDGVQKFVSTRTSTSADSTDDTWPARIQDPSLARR